MGEYLEAMWYAEGGRSVKYYVIIEKGEQNYSAYVPDLPGCVTTGGTVEETLRNIREAIEGHLELLLEMGEPVPEPRSEGAEVEVKVA
jgi:predicted RNase H-like HicB family nuclease